MKDKNIINPSDRILDELLSKKTVIAEEADEESHCNRLDKKYLVDVDSQKIIVPQFCTCCLQQTMTMERISRLITQKSGRLKTTRTVSIDMPFCSDCREHRDKLKPLKWLIISLTVTISIIIDLIYIALNEKDSYSSLILLLVTITIYTFLGLIIRVTQLDQNHSTYQDSCWLSKIEISGFKTTYAFTNWRYAKLFSDANHVEMQEGKRNNRTKSNRLILAVEEPFWLLFISLLINFLFIWLFADSIMILIKFISKMLN